MTAYVVPYDMCLKDEYSTPNALAVQLLIQAVHALVDLHERAEAIIVELPSVGVGGIDTLEFDQLRHVSEADLAQPSRGDKGRTARIGLNWVDHLADFDIQHIGKYLAPDIGSGPTAGDADPLNCAAHEFRYRRG